MKPKKSRTSKGPLGNVKRVHFIGIGGAGMSGIAAVLLGLGYSVTGSDLKPSGVTQRLAKRGARIRFGHQAANVVGADVAVYSAAVPADNPEIQEARRRSVPVIPRTEMLAELMRLKYGIAVSGTHGKTTTTSMIGLVMKEAKLHPTLVIGGQVDALKPDAKPGKGPYLVAEACEAFGEFFLLSPMIAVVTNIDDDHLDHYGSLEKVPFHGCVILGVDDPQARAILHSIKRRVLTYGLGPGAKISAADLKLEGMGSTFSLLERGKRLGRVRLNVPGRFNVQNALAAAATALELGIPFRAVAKGLEKFRGAHRRFELKGSYRGAPVVDDYAHHPTAVAETLKAAKRFAAGRKLVCLFQPHLFSRTRTLKDKFGGAFGDADEVLVADIYPAREKPIPGVTANTLVESLRAHGHPHAEAAGDRTALLRGLREMIDKDMVLLTMGAGDVWKVGEELLGKNK